MIKSINIKNIASYDENGVQINDLKKVNFFFGFNGAGKSTIAKFLYNLSLDNTKRDIHFNNCSQNGYDEANHQLLIFDENFTEINFNKNPLLKGVFSLNETNDIIDDQIKTEEELIKLYKEQKEKKEKLIQDIENDKLVKEKALLDYCWAQRNTFSTFSKIAIPYSGSKPNHLHKLKQIVLNPLINVPSIEKLSESYNLLYERELTEISQIISSKLYQEIRIIERNLEGLLQEIIIGNEDVDIAELIKSINARSWVEAGVKFLEQTVDTCPFCQQKTIDEGLKKQFEEYFDETYKGKIELLENLLNQYTTKTDAFLVNISNVQSLYNPNNLVSNTYIQLQELFKNNIKAITEKIEKANEKKDLISLCTLKKELSTINQSIRDNNTVFSELDQNRNILMGDIWLFMAEKSNRKIEELTAREKKYESIIATANCLIERYNSHTIISKQTIESLRGQTINTKEAIDNINLILKRSGFQSFEIAEKETANNISQYYLKRPDSTDENPIFKSLSEGEKSFISFLYFYQLCIGSDDIQNNGTKKKIIVIDDPVSSLDSQVLFIVSTLIHQLILRKSNESKAEKKLFKNETIEQVFILTHNLYFYKEVSFDKRPFCTDHWHFKISKISNCTKIEGDYNSTITDDYSLMWKNLKNIFENLPHDNNQNILISNLMRRIIESYVNFVGFGKDSWASLLNDDPESTEHYIKCAFISNINDGSHKVSPLDSLYYQKISDSNPQILFNVFKTVFESIGNVHYNMMMEIEELN